MNLAPGTIHLYLACPDEINDPLLLSQYQSLLNAEESARWQRFHFAEHKHQYLVTRALIRSSLSLYVEKHPRNWRFSANRYGRPEIIKEHNEPSLRFNISHTDGLIMCGIVLDADIGVDVENLQRNNATLEIAERFFSGREIDALYKTAAGERKQRFFDFWTLKEAYIKARGMGLSLPLDQFSFDIDQDQSARISFDASLQDNPDYWHFWRFKLSANHIAAVAIKSETNLQYQLTVNKVVPLNNYPASSGPHGHR